MRRDETLDEGEPDETPGGGREPGHVTQPGPGRGRNDQAGGPGRGETGRPSPRLEIINPDDPEDDDFDDDEDGDDFDDGDDDDEEGVRTVLITGASGNLGRKLRAAWGDAYDLVLIDRAAEPDDPEVIAADLGELDDRWVTHFHGVDTVVHLAANPDEFASWEELEGPNLDVLCNVFHAAALAGVDRLVFASSNHAMGGYRELGDMPITVDLAPRPDGPYGATKLMGERLGRSLARAFDITFVALRLGWVQPGDNRPETLPDDWARATWLSNRDFIRLLDCAVEAELDDRLVAVVNGVSNNSGTRWDLGPAAELLGYYPEDDAYAEEL
jgi:NAD+ dependent glucose-6-phosphate dehydrogenase